MATLTPETGIGLVAPGRAPVCFVVAMRSEAAPLIGELGLDRWRVGAGPFLLFRSDEAALVVSGVGKVAAAAAATYLFARLGEPTNAAWINVGIAGHRSRSVGEAVLAHKVTDAGLGRSWSPTLVFEPPVATSEVITVEEVERTYAEDAVYDMEAAGFVAATARFASSDLVHVLKVVSDNAVTPVEGIDRAMIRACIGDRMAEVKAVRDSLRELACELAEVEAEEESLPSFLDRWPFTASQRHRLRRTLQRLRALGMGQAAESTQWAGLASAREVLEAMDKAVERAS